MDLLTALQIGLWSLWSNKLRSSLTALGIIIGVAAVLLMTALGTGASIQIAKQIESVGTNLILVLPGASTSSGVSHGAGTSPSLTIRDSMAIQKGCARVLRTAPIWGGVAQVKAANRNWSTEIRGTTPAYQFIRRWTVEEGRFFTDQEVRSRAKVAVLGETVKEQIFGPGPATGKFIRIRRIPFQVIGILGRKGPTPRGTDQDDVIYVPVTTAQARLFPTVVPGQVQAILVEAITTDHIPEAMAEINRLLRERHRIVPGREENFSVKDLSEMMEASRKSTRIMAILLGTIALISLVVGGIGIMNIMLVSVTERTREIGIRMAVGAKQRDILLQFLLEAVILSILGGIAGVIAGWAGKGLLQGLTGWPMVISVDALLVALFFAALTGIFFGIYPAWKASRLQPIDALRQH